MRHILQGKQNMCGCQEIEENGALCVTDACSHLRMTSCPVTFQSRAKSMVGILHYNKQRYSFFLQDMVDNLRALVQEMLMFSKQTFNDWLCYFCTMVFSSRAHVDGCHLSAPETDSTFTCLSQFSRAFALQTGSACT